MQNHYAHDGTVMYLLQLAYTYVSTLAHSNGCVLQGTTASTRGISPGYLPGVFTRVFLPVTESYVDSVASFIPVPNSSVEST